jgi:hypothetical protein
MWLSDSTCSRLLSCFGNLIIKKILKYQLPNVYKSVEIQMFIMSKYSTFPNCSIFDCCNDNRYIDIFLSVTCSQAVTAQSVRRQIFWSRGLRIVSRRRPNFCLFALFSLFLYIQMFCYTIMKLFITLLENVNKSRTSARRLCLFNHRAVILLHTNYDCFIL